MVRRPLAAVLALLAGLLPALAQIPSTLPANTVVGRLGVTAGRPQAIPFAALFGLCPEGGFVGGFGSGASATLRCQVPSISATPTAQVDMWIFPSEGTTGGGVPFHVRLPEGADFSCTGSTTSCFQEAINKAFPSLGTASGDLNVLGGNVTTGGAVGITGNAISWPVAQGKRVRVGAVSLGQATEGGWQTFDSCMMCDIEFAGAQVGSTLFKPVNFPPEDHAAGKVVVDSRFFFTTAGEMTFDFTTPGSFVATKIEVNEVNVGGTAYGFNAKDLVGGANFYGNHFITRHLHGVANAGTAIRTPTTTGSQISGHNFWTVNVSQGTSTNILGIDSGSSNDLIIGWLDLGTTPVASLRYRSGACGNIAIIPYNSSWSTYDDSGGCSGSNRNITLGNGKITVGGAPLVEGNGALGQYGVILASGNNSVTATTAGSTGLPLVGQGASYPLFLALGVVGGGTGLTTYALGDTIYSSATDTLAKLAGNTTTTRKFLRQTGTGSASQAPTWDTVIAADVPGSALTKTDDTNVTLTLGGSATTALLNAASITAGWTGTLAAARLNANVVQSIVNDTNVTGSISAQALTLGWTGTLAAARLNANVVQSIVNDTNVTGSISAQALTLAWSGQLAVGRGGTGIASYAIGDLLYASGATTLSKLADVATGNALISGGLTTAPAWGKIGLTTHISGTLGVGNGGTGTATTFTQGSAVFAGASGVYSQDNANFFYDATNHFLSLGVGSAPRARLDLLASGTVNTNADTPGTANVVGPGTAPTVTPQFSVGSNDAYNAGAVATITFQGRYQTGSTDAANFAAIEAGKENTTSGNLQGQISFYTRNAAGNFLSALSLDSSQNLTSVATIRANTGFSANGTAGTSATIAVRNGAGAASCNLVVTFGLVTSTTC